MSYPPCYWQLLEGNAHKPLNLPYNYGAAAVAPCSNQNLPLSNEVLAAAGDVLQLAAAQLPAARRRGVLRRAAAQVGAAARRAQHAVGPGAGRDGAAGADDNQASHARHHAAPTH
jgi:hypothetical protein